MLQPMNDLKFAFRQLARNPGFTAAAALTLALGIGANTAIYSVVNALLLNPVPGPEPDRLIQIGERSHGNKDEPRFGGVTAPAVEVLRAQREFFSDLVWMRDLYSGEENSRVHRGNRRRRGLAEFLRAVGYQTDSRPDFLQSRGSATH